MGPRNAIVDHTVDNPGLVSDVAHAAAVAARMVNGGLPREDAAWMAYTYVRDHLRYREETDPEGQMIRMPWRFIADGVGDCKSQAVFIAAVCAASGCKCVLRFATLPGDEEPGHVYAIVDGTVADPLLEFGRECDYIRSHDVPIN